MRLSADLMSQLPSCPLRQQRVQVYSGRCRRVRRIRRVVACGPVGPHVQAGDVCLVIPQLQG